MLKSNDSSLVIFAHHYGKISAGKEFFLVISEILRPFVHTLNADEKYFPGNSENLRQPIPMELSVELKTFYHLFTSFSKSTFNFKHFEKKMTLIAYVFPKL